MTRLASDLNRQMAARRVVEPDRDWFFYTILGVGPGGIGVFTSDILPEGTIIHEVRFEIKALAVVDHLHEFEATIALADQSNPPVSQFPAMDRIIEFDVGKGNIWYSVLPGMSVEYPCRKTITGAQKRIALLIRNGTLVNLDFRAGVLFSRV